MTLQAVVLGELDRGSSGQQGGGSSTGREPQVELGWGAPGPGRALGGARAAEPRSECSLRQGQSWAGWGARPNASYYLRARVGAETQGLEQAFQRGRRRREPWTWEFWIPLARGRTGLGSSKGSSTFQWLDLWAKACGTRDPRCLRRRRGGAAAGGGKERGKERDAAESAAWWREDGNVGVRGPPGRAAPRLPLSVPAPAPASARKQASPLRDRSRRARLSHLRQARPACPELPPPSAGSHPRTAGWKLSRQGGAVPARTFPRGLAPGTLAARPCAARAPTRVSP